MGTMEIIAVILMAISLSACAGIRAFIPPLALSIMALAGQIQLGPGYEWIGSWPVLLCFAVAVILEIAADKFPGVDHALDAAGLVIKPVAGFLLTTAMVSNIDPLLGLVLGIIVGAGSAGAVQLVRAKLRLASSAFTAGIANPVVSVIEDGSAIGATILAVIIPVVTAVLFFGGLFLAWRLYKKVKRKNEPVVVE